MKIIWSPVALRRVEEIVDHLSSDRPGAATKWVDGLFDVVARLRSFPDRGRIVPELRQPSIEPSFLDTESGSEGFEYEVTAVMN